MTIEEVINELKKYNPEAELSGIMHNKTVYTKFGLGYTSTSEQFTKKDCKEVYFVISGK